MAFMTGNWPQGLGAFGENFMKAYLGMEKNERERLAELRLKQKLESEIQAQEIQNAFYKQQMAGMMQEQQFKAGEQQRLQQYRQDYQNLPLTQYGQFQTASNEWGVPEAAETPQKTQPSEESQLSLYQRAFPEKVGEFAMLRAELEAKRTGTQKVKGEIAAQPEQLNLLKAHTGYYNSEAFKNYMAAFGQTEKPAELLKSYDSLTKEFFQSRGFGDFTDQNIIKAGINYLNSPEGAQDFVTFANQVKQTYSVAQGAGGFEIYPTKANITAGPFRPGMGTPQAPVAPGVPMAGGPPQAPGAPMMPPKVPGVQPSQPNVPTAQPLMGGKGQVKKPLDVAAQDNINFMMNIGDTMLKADELLKANPNVTGPGAAIWSMAAEKIPGLPVNKQFQEIKMELAKLYDIVYAKSGKQINEVELKQIEKYKPSEGDKPEVIALKMEGLKRHLYSIIYNRGMNYVTNGYGIPDSFIPYMRKAEEYFRTSKSAPLNWGMAPVKEGWQPIGAAPAEEKPWKLVK